MTGKAGQSKSKYQKGAIKARTKENLAKQTNLAATLRDQQERADETGPGEALHSAPGQGEELGGA